MVDVKVFLGIFVSRWVLWARVFLMVEVPGCFWCRHIQVRRSLRKLRRQLGSVW